jgi:4-amino-4-deoxy-L-arabinose transferase-like glycosyltransferase
MPRRILDLTAAVILVVALVSVAGVRSKAPSQQPFPDGAEYADSAQRLADDQGYVTYVHGPVAEAPRYPPGLSLALAPFGMVGHYPSNIELGGKVLGLVYVLVMVGAAWGLGGPLAAAIAGLVVLISPFARENAAYTLSDGLVASLQVLMLPILRRLTPEGERLSGAMTGFASVIRLTAGVSLIATLAACPRSGIRRVLLWALPFLVGLGLLQWALYGNPLYTGYDYWDVGFRQTFSFANVFGAQTAREGAAVYTDLLGGHLMGFVCPCGVGGSIAQLNNFWFYPAVLAGGFWVYAPPVLPLLGLWWAWRHRREPVGRYALVLVFGSLLVFYFYLFQAARFVAGPASVLVVLSAVAIADGVRAFGRRWMTPSVGPGRVGGEPPSGQASTLAQASVI